MARSGKQPRDYCPMKPSVNLRYPAVSHHARLIPLLVVRSRKRNLPPSEP
jgi:hypothetical protein